MRFFKGVEFDAFKKVKIIMTYTTKPQKIVIATPTFPPEIGGSALYAEILSKEFGLLGYGLAEGFLFSFVQPDDLVFFGHHPNISDEGIYT